MSSPKRMILAGAALLIGYGVFAQGAAQAGTERNALASNGVLGNALASNALASNALASNGMRQNGVADRTFGAESERVGADVNRLRLRRVTLKGE
jgi:hypothetical protein